MATAVFALAAGCLFRVSDRTCTLSSLAKGRVDHELQHKGSGTALHDNHGHWLSLK